MPQSLFDDLVHSDKSSASWSDSEFGYLNRTGRHSFATVRSTMDGWFRAYPRSHRLDLRNRFRSEDPYVHRAAFFELMLHELQLRLGCALTIHPTLPGTAKAPDFSVVDQDKLSWYLEATVATDASVGDRGVRARIAAVLDAIGKVQSDRFFLSVDVLRAGSGALSGPSVRHFMETRLAATDTESLAIKSPPEWIFESDDWRILFRPFARKVGAPRSSVVGSSSPGMPHWVTTTEALRRAVRRKAGRYGSDLQLPYVIAVLDASRDRGDLHDLLDALFGTRVITFPPDDPSQAQEGRAANGAWHTTKPINTRNSAVLFVTHATAWSIVESKATLVLNPFARLRYAGALDRLPRVVSDGHGALVRVDGVKLSEALGLPDDWPGRSD